MLFLQSLQLCQDRVLLVNNACRGLASLAKVSGERAGLGLKARGLQCWERGPKGCGRIFPLTEAQAPSLPLPSPPCSLCGRLAGLWGRRAAEVLRLEGTCLRSQAGLSESSGQDPRASRVRSVTWPLLAVPRSLLIG